MKTLPLLLCLLFIPQTPDRTVPLVFRDRVEIVKLSAAQNEYDEIFTRHCRFGGAYGKDLLCEPMSEVEESRFEALTISLGTYPGSTEALPRNTDTRAFLDNEIRRGVRKPMQGRN